MELEADESYQRGNETSEAALEGAHRRARELIDEMPEGASLSPGIPAMSLSTASLRGSRAPAPPEPSICANHDDGGARGHAPPKAPSTDMIGARIPGAFDEVASNQGQRVSIGQVFSWHVTAAHRRCVAPMRTAGGVDSPSIKARRRRASPAVTTTPSAGTPKARAIQVPMGKRRPRAQSWGGKV